MANFQLKVLSGAEAAAEAMRQIEPGVVAIYPITPQTYIAEKFSQFVADGLVKTEQVNVESEHSALSVVLGAEAAGVRAMTATCSQGLALMWEVVSIVSGLRLPVVMNVVTRALSAPINIHGDHSDTMGCRDLSWLQIFSENPEEVYENNLLAIRLAEDQKVLLPVMVCQDGFITSHGAERVKIYDDKIVKNFLGQYQPNYSLLNIKKPVTIGSLVLPDYFMEIKELQRRAMEEAKKIYLKIGKELSKITNHQYNYFEAYKIEDAQAIIVVMGSSAGTTRFVVDQMRKKNKKVGLLKIKLFRPFPYQEVSDVFKKIKNLKIGVLDRADSFGAYPPLFNDLKVALSEKKIKIQSYVFGLGGRDIRPEKIAKVFLELLAGKIDKEVKYI